jgi:hypothetical protein
MNENMITYFCTIPYSLIIHFIHYIQVHFSGKKWDDKLHRWHTGYLGGLRERPAKDMLERSPTLILKKAILGMLYRNNLREGYMEPRLKNMLDPSIHIRHNYQRVYDRCRYIHVNVWEIIILVWGIGTRRHHFKWVVQKRGVDGCHLPWGNILSTIKLTFAWNHSIVQLNNSCVSAAVNSTWRFGTLDDSMVSLEYLRVAICFYVFIWSVCLPSCIFLACIYCYSYMNM